MNEDNLRVIKNAYEASNLNKAKFSKELKVSPGHISDLLNGNGKASDSLAELARVKFLSGKPSLDSPSKRGQNTEDSMTENQKDQMIEMQGKLIKKLEAEIVELKGNS